MLFEQGQGWVEIAGLAEPATAGLVSIAAGELLVIGAVDPFQQPARVVNAGVGAHQVKYRQGVLYQVVSQPHRAGECVGVDGTGPAVTEVGGEVQQGRDAAGGAGELGGPAGQMRQVAAANGQAGFQSALEVQQQLAGVGLQGKDRRVVAGEAGRGAQAGGQGLQFCRVSVGQHWRHGWRSGLAPADQACWETVEEAGQQPTAYLDAGDLTSSSRATYRRVLTELARDLGPERPADSLTADELATWFARTRDTHAPATWNRDRVIVRSFVRTLHAQGVPLEPPVIGYRRLRPVRTRALTRAEVARILGLPVPLREKTLWTLAYESAARASELLGLDADDLDLANRRAVVTSKGGAREWITWSTSTARLLPRLLKGRREGPVFTTRGASRVVVAKLDQAPGGTARLSYRRTEELFKAATGSTLHQFRHSALTHLAEDGASAPMLMTKSRHRSIASLARYARPGVEALQRWEAEHDRARRRR
jgi:integrase